MLRANYVAPFYQIHNEVVAFILYSAISSTFSEENRTGKLRTFVCPLLEVLHLIFFLISYVSFYYSMSSLCDS